jgi:hypothetical protein
MDSPARKDPAVWYPVVEKSSCYQTLIASIIHKYAFGALICKALIDREEPEPCKVSSDKKKK